MRPLSQHNEHSLPGTAIGVDLGGTQLKLVVLRGDRCALRLRAPVLAHSDGVKIVEQIAVAVEHAQVVTRLPRDARRRPLGVSLPGLLDERRRTPRFVANLPCLAEFPLAARLSGRLKRRVILEPDSNAGAVGEAMVGAGRGVGRVLYLTLGTGVGAALVVEGVPVRVSHHTIGQVAHIRIAATGPRCSCGGRGCVESTLSAGGIVARALRARRAGARIPRDSCASAHAVAEAGRGGSTAARHLLREVGELLGETCALLVNLFSPDIVVVGGGVSLAGELLLVPAQTRMAERLIPRLRGRVLIRRAKLAPFSGAFGAAFLARNG